MSVCCFHRTSIELSGSAITAFTFEVSNLTAKLAVASKILCSLVSYLASLHIKKILITLLVLVLMFKNYVCIKVFLSPDTLNVFLTCRKQNINFSLIHKRHNHVLLCFLPFKEEYSLPPQSLFRTATKFISHLHYFN